MDDLNPNTPAGGPTENDVNNPVPEEETGTAPEESTPEENVPMEGVPNGSTPEEVAPTEGDEQPEEGRENSNPML